MNCSKSTLLRHLPRALATRTPVKPLTTQTRTMAFFPRSFYNTDSSFAPFFRMLDDMDKYSRQSQDEQSTTRRSAMPSWQPRFDIRETRDNYELHGELPGISKDQVNVEFSDPQTMLIRGHVERFYSSGTPPSGRIEDVSGHEAIEGETKPSLKAKVEDEDAEQSSKSSSDNTVAHKTAEKESNTTKYWLTERSVGDFSRSFHFPSRIDQENVSASFRDGILSIVVPKARKHESRRVAIN